MSFYQFLAVILDLFLLITSMTFLMNHQVNLFDNPFHLNYIKMYKFLLQFVCWRIFT